MEDQSVVGLVGSEPAFLPSGGRRPSPGPLAPAAARRRPRQCVRALGLTAERPPRDGGDAPVSLTSKTAKRVSAVPLGYF